MANYYYNIADSLFKAVEIIGPLANIISCLILTLVLCLVLKLSRQVQVGSDDITKKKKVNVLVTISHICITLACTFTQAILFFTKNKSKAFRMGTAFYFFNGLAELFLSLMIWFILNREKQPTVIVDGDRVYAVAEVIKNVGINEDCDNLDEVEPEDPNSNI